MISVAQLSLLLLGYLTVVKGRLGTKGVLPFNGENGAGETRTIPGCHLGEQFHALEDTWQPALEPVGVMHCVICQCQPVIKKGILQQKGRVNCRNIKHDCPQTNCPHPRLIPGQCCKLCQGQDPLRVHAQSLRRFPSFRLSAGNDRQIASPPKAIHSSGHQTKEYVAILVGSSAQTHVRTSTVARGHFRLRDSSVYLSIQYEGTEQPRQFRILDSRGRVLFLQDFPPDFTTQNNKLCGVWQPLSRSNVHDLNQGRLVALVSTAETPDGLIAGNIFTHRALSKETFSAVLHPQLQTGNGGLMMVTISGNGDVNFIVKLAGNPLAPGRAGQVRVSFEKNNKVFHESRGEMFGRELEFAEVWSDLTTRESRMLARGAVRVKVVTSQGVILIGDVIPKQSCTVLHSVISLRESLAPLSVLSGAAGTALMHLSRDGQLTYSVEIMNLSSPITAVTIETAPNKRGKTRRMCSVSLSRGVYQQRDRIILRNGTCDKFNSRHVHALLLGDMFVNVATRDQTLSALRGQIHELIYNPDIDKETVPRLMLSGSGMVPPVSTDVAGTAWVILDSACALQFELVVSGMVEGEDAGLLAQIVSLPAEGNNFVEKKAIKLTLKEFVGNVVRGVVPTLTPQFYQLLNSGQVLLRIATKAQPQGAIGTRLQLPNRCVVKNPKSSTLGILDDQEEHSSAQKVTKCVIDGVTYKDGDVWVPRDSPSSCVTCQCKRGREECHQSVCPAVDCDHPIIPTGECCPQCIARPVQTLVRKCYFDGDKRWHQMGTKWHPYMPPFGYMTCAICSCMANGSGVNCTRPPCPALTCPESVAVRKNPSDCCKVCPENTDENASPGSDKPQGDIQMTGSCPFQGLRYTDGATWNPRVQPFGRLACVTCRCIHGATSCRRQKCPKLTCAKRVRDKGSCCPKCADGSGSTGRKKHRRRGLSARRTLGTT